MGKWILVAAVGRPETLHGHVEIPNPCSIGKISSYDWIVDIPTDRLYAYPPGNLGGEVLIFPKSFNTKTRRWRRPCEEEHY